MHNIKSKAPAGKSGDYRIEEFTVTKEDAKFNNMRAAFSFSTRSNLEAGTYKRLMRGHTLVMSDTPVEQQDHRSFVSMAKGHILIAGLGLGITTQAVLQKEDVEKVTVVEISSDVIKLTAPSFMEEITGGRLEIIHDNFMTWKSPRGSKYEAVWIDIWDNICADDKADMDRLSNRYRRKSEWVECWGRYLIR